MTTPQPEGFPTSEEEIVDAISKLGDGAVKTITTDWSPRHARFLTMVYLNGEVGGGSCNGTGVTRMESLSNAHKVTSILLASRGIKGPSDDRD